MLALLFAPSIWRIFVNPFTRQLFIQNLSWASFAGEIDSSYFLRIWVEVCESQGADPLVGRWEKVAKCIGRARASHLDLGIVFPAITPSHRLHINPFYRATIQGFLWLILDLKGRWEQKFCFIGKNIFSLKIMQIQSRQGYNRSVGSQPMK